MSLVTCNTKWSYPLKNFSCSCSSVSLRSYCVKSKRASKAPLLAINLVGKWPPSSYRIYILWKTKEMPTVGHNFHSMLSNSLLYKNPTSPKFPLLPISPYFPFHQVFSFSLADRFRKEQPREWLSLSLRKTQVSNLSDPYFVVYSFCFTVFWQFIFLYLECIVWISTNRCLYDSIFIRQSKKPSYVYRQMWKILVCYKIVQLLLLTFLDLQSLKFLFFWSNMDLAFLVDGSIQFDVC